VKRGILSAAFALATLALLAGCGHQNSADAIHIQPKWQGQPYHIAFDKPPAKPDPSGITLPVVKYTANPEELETRACLVVRFDDSALADSGQTMNQMVMGPVDIHGDQGALPADYMAAADQGLARLLADYHVKGKVKVSVLLARSSISTQPGQDEIAEKQLSDWLPIDLDFKSPHPGR